MTDDGLKIYEFMHRGRAVRILAANPDQASLLFQERFGYYPTKEQENDNA